MKTKDNILIYAEHIDHDGRTHYGVNIYNSCTGQMTYFSDLVDTDSRKAYKTERNDH